MVRHLILLLAMILLSTPVYAEDATEKDAPAENEGTSKLTVCEAIARVIAKDTNILFNTRYSKTDPKIVDGAHLVATRHIDPYLQLYDTMDCSSRMLRDEVADQLGYAAEMNEDD